MRLVLATRNAHKLREFGAAAAAPTSSMPLPDDVRAAARDGDDVRRERADQGAGRRRGHRPAGDRRRLGHRGGRARRRPGRPLGALRRRGRHRRGEPGEAAARGAARRATRVSRTSARSPTWSPAARRADLAEGRCEGELTHDPRGDGGFGYDPAFVPADLGDGRTMAELDPPRRTRSATAAGPLARCWTSQLERAPGRRAPRPVDLPGAGALAGRGRRSERPPALLRPQLASVAGARTRRRPGRAAPRSRARPACRSSRTPS